MWQQGQGQEAYRAQYDMGPPTGGPGEWHSPYSQGPASFSQPNYPPQSGYGYPPNLGDNFQTGTGRFTFEDNQYGQYGAQQQQGGYADQDWQPPTYAGQHQPYPPYMGNPQADSMPQPPSSAHVVSQQPQHPMGRPRASQSAGSVRTGAGALAAGGKGDDSVLGLVKQVRGGSKPRVGPVKLTPAESVARSASAGTTRRGVPAKPCQDRFSYIPKKEDYSRKADLDNVPRERKPRLPFSTQPKGTPSAQELQFGAGLSRGASNHGYELPSSSGVAVPGRLATGSGHNYDYDPYGGRPGSSLVGVSEYVYPNQLGLHQPGFGTNNTPVYVEELDKLMNDLSSRR